MSNIEYSPQYFIRILTSSGEINLNNVISITTSKDINSDTGTFEIVLDYNQNVLNSEKSLYNAVTYRQNSIFFQIKAMDYIEIYLAREIDPTLGSNNGFGVYDKNGIFIRNFDEKIENNQNIKLDKTKTDALDIVERIFNPHLIFCGFIDGIRNNFNASESSTNNSISIRGKCLAKFLALHYLFFNFPYADIFLEQAKAAISLNGLRANEAIDTVLTRFCIGIFTKQKIDISKSDLNDNEKIKKLDSNSFPDHYVVWDDKLKDQTFIKTIHKVAPSFRYIYWGTNINQASKYVDNINELTSENGYFKWGRMEYSKSLNRNVLNITAEQPVLSILKQSARLPFNELFIDEIGNIVLRKTLDAWNYEDGLDENGSILENEDSYIKNWVELKQEDIRSWNFDISDDELKTIVIDVPSAFFIGLSPTMIGQVGVAPISKLTIGSLLEAEKSKTKDEQKIKDITAEQAQLQDTFKTVEKMQSNHLDEYDFSTTEGILEFWQRFGLRPVTINDIYSDDFSSFYMSAWSLFEKYSNYWWKGTISVKGNSKYKIGQKLKIRDFAMDNNDELRDFNCYIQSISHRYIWGQDWTTIIKFTRGQIEGTVSSQSTVKKED